MRRGVLATAMVAVVAAGTAGCAAGSGSAAPSGTATKLTKVQRSALAEGRRRSMDKNAYTEYATRQQQVMGDCMRRAGFMDFAVPDFMRPVQPTSPTGDLQDPAQAGFGMSTGLERHANPLGETGVDRYRAALPESRQPGYDAAFGRCNVQAAKQLGPPPGSVTIHGDTSGMYEEAERRVAADPQLVRATTQWSGCMVRAGYRVATRSDLLKDVERRAMPFIQEFIAAGNNAPPGAKVRVRDVFTGDRLAKLAQVQQYERNAAVADARCGGPALGRLRDRLYNAELAKLEQEG